MIIGSHVSFSKEELLGSAKEAVEYGANTFMIYTGAPQNTIRKEISSDLTRKAHEYMKNNGIDIKNVIAHAPYIVNLANKENLDKWHFGIDFITNECHRCETLGIKYLVLHPGSAVNYTKEEALNNIKEALKIILEDNSKTTILLETMALKGTEVGSLEDLKFLLDLNSERLGVCLDTCHLNDAGYNLSNYDELISIIKETIGLERVHCIHLNDSKNTCGSHKDRHENLGYGTIGYDNILKIATKEEFKSIPKILETPYIINTKTQKKEYPPYKFEIEGLKNKEFVENLASKVSDYFNK